MAPVSGRIGNDGGTTTKGLDLTGVVSLDANELVVPPHQVEELFCSQKQYLVDPFFILVKVASFWCPCSAGLLQDAPSCAHAPWVQQ